MFKGLNFVGEIFQGLMGALSMLFKPLFSAITGTFGKIGDMISSLFTPSAPASGGDGNEGGLLNSLFNAFSAPQAKPRPAVSPATKAAWSLPLLLSSTFGIASQPPEPQQDGRYLYAEGATAGYDPVAAAAEFGKTDVKSLDPQFQGPVQRIMDRLRQKGWDPVIASGLRTQDEQDKKLAEKVSAAKYSWHQDGFAVDIVQRGLGWEGEAADKKFQFWKDLQEAAEAEGMVSGAVWTKEKHGIEADVAHVQMKVKGGHPHRHNHEHPDKEKPKAPEGPRIA